MESLFKAIAEDIWVLIPLFGISVGIIAVAGGLLVDHFKAKNYERSRREIAAYIAEGSMSPEEGERLLAAKPGKQSRC